jgi:serine/threonine protein kinase
VPLQPGQTLLHYRIVDKLGEGGMGAVYRAEDTRLGREIAIKVMPAELAADAERRRRFEQEARAVAALKHPNIVTVYSVEEADTPTPSTGSGQAGSVLFITMELIEGRPLSELIPKGGLDLVRLFELAIPAAEALSSAHAKRITHRDLKPSNMMLDADGRLKVLDFGLAKLLAPDDATGADAETATVATSGPSTEEGRILGTAAYMSPEQAEGKPVDARTDIFSLGVVLYEMATGRSGRHFDLDYQLDPQGLPAARFGPEARPAAAPRPHHRALPGEKPRQAVPDCARHCQRAGGSEDRDRLR